MDCFQLQRAWKVHLNKLGISYPYITVSRPRLLPARHNNADTMHNIGEMPRIDPGTYEVDVAFLEKHAYPRDEEGIHKV